MADLSEMEIEIDLDEVVREILEDDNVCKVGAAVVPTGPEHELYSLICDVTFDSAAFEAALYAALRARGVEFPEPGGSHGG